MKSSYQASDYWPIKDKAWLAERKARWQRIAGRFKQQGATGTEIRLYEQYFVKGNLKVNDLRDFNLGVTPELNLAQQLAWHPSSDESVWWQVVEMNFQSFDGAGYGYQFLSLYGEAYTYTEICSPELDNTVFAGREAELYQFFFRNLKWLEFMQQRKGELKEMNLAHQGLFRKIAALFAAIKRNYPNNSIYPLYDSLPLQAVSSVAKAYTSEKFLKDSSREKYWPAYVKDIGALAEFYVDRQHLIPEQRRIVETFAEQIEQSAPEWQALWQQLKQEALANYQPPTAITVPEPEEPEPTYSPDAVAAEPWPGELMALKQYLEQQGYEVSPAEADVNAILQQHFANRCVYFGSFIESMALEAEDYDKPYPAFTAPLQALCAMKDDAKLSYARRGERVTMKVNGERLGVADLEEPEGEETADYFAAIIRLAQQWFPQQVFVYGYESLHLYILPAALVRWLEANGFENSLNYFGGQQEPSAETPLAGLAMVFTGTFSAGPRDELAYQAENLGARVQSAVNSKTDYLVCGSKVGASKLAKAEALGVKVISEAEYQALISQSS